MQAPEPPLLRFGRYRPPRYKVGGTLTCTVRGRRLVVGTGDAPTPWPMTAANSYAGMRFHVVCGDLARAPHVESLAAICYW